MWSRLRKGGSTNPLMRACELGKVSSKWLCRERPESSTKWLMAKDQPVWLKSPARTCRGIAGPIPHG